MMQLKNRRLGLTAAGERVYAYARLVLDHQSLLTDNLDTLRVGQNRLRAEAFNEILLRNN
jgi:DNA-binding transcriptional LysR family regulator